MLEKNMFWSASLIDARKNVFFSVLCAAAIHSKADILWFA